MSKLLKSHQTDVPSGSAISIKQPYVEEILRGIKKIEYRSKITYKRGRIFLYASASKVTEKPRWENLGLEMYSLPTGMLVGSVEIIDCKYNNKTKDYEYILKNPKRFRTPITPIMKAQPCFFFPFGKDYELL